ncbi:hypothetical protein [Peribacillus sp. FSL E2-0159]|uniref:hypothetical protein n=1 Tax=Peribacillus sp. FSL E2-0159 TaxID=2975289 RepID=UPI00315B1B98
MTKSSLINGLGSDSELIIIAGSGEQLELSAMDFLKGPNTVRFIYWTSKGNPRSR